jgi:hypothetical protein
MISYSQSVFVKKRCIHDNFILVQGIIKELHRKKVLTQFLKLDITKAIDSVSWVYLLEVLERLGFGAKWRDWISLALTSSSSRILTSGVSGKGTPSPHAFHSSNEPPPKNTTTESIKRTSTPNLTKVKGHQGILVCR